MRRLSPSQALRGLLRHLARARWTEPFRRDWLVATASVVTIIFLPTVILQLWDLSEQRTLRGLQVAMSIDQQLSSGSAVKIRYAIRNRKPILVANRGSFTRDELIDYLNIFEGLADAYDLGHIDRETVFLWHGTPIVQASRNEEIKQFIADERRTDADPDSFASGFEELGKMVIEDEARVRPKPPKRPQEIKRP